MLRNSLVIGLSEMIRFLKYDHSTKSISLDTERGPPGPGSQKRSTKITSNKITGRRVKG